MYILRGVLMIITHDRSAKSIQSFRVLYAVFLVLFLFLQNQVQGQAAPLTGELQGRIFNTGGAPVADVRVVIPALGRVQSSDAAGLFKIQNIEAGIITVTFVHLGYRTRIISDLRINAAGITRLDSVVLESRTYTSGEIIVTASRAERSAEQVPAQINIIPASLIKNREAQTTAEALREEAGIAVQKTNHAGGSAIIRGLSSNQILILSDGIRINNSTYRLGSHQYLTTIDQFMVDEIEVVRGPASVLYGSDALGGTINVLSKKPDLYSRQFNFDFNFFSRYASADNEKSVHGDFAASYRKLAVQAGYSYKSYGDLRRGANSKYPQLENSTNGLKQSPNSFDAYDLDTKVLFGLTPLQTLTLLYQRCRQNDVPRYDKYETENYYRWIYEPQSRDLLYLKYESILSTQSLAAFSGTLSYQEQQEGRDMQKTSGSALSRERDRVRTGGLSLNLTTPYRKQQLTLGTEIYRDKIASARFIRSAANSNFIKDSRGRYPDKATYLSLGIFVQDEIELHTKWSLVSGIRWSYFQTDFNLLAAEAADSAQSGINLNFQALTGSLGMIYKPWPQVLFRLNLAQAFRAPNLNDLSKFGESKGNIFEIPDRDLGAEKLSSIDLGCELKFSRLVFKTAVYYAAIHDLIASAEATYHGSAVLIRDSVEYKIKSKQNTGSAFIRGLETGMQYKFYKTLNLYFNLTATFGQNTAIDEPMGGIPPIYGLAGLGWSGPAFCADFYLRFAAKQDRLSADDKDDSRIPPGGTPGWWIVNLRGCWHSTDNTILRFSVENLFDYNYREHGSGLNGPGRNFVVSFELGI